MKLNWRDVVLLALVAAVVYLLVKSRTNSMPVDATTEQVQEEEHEGEIAPEMHKFQLYFNKLWFAGKNENWQLADFYVHELEETAESVEALHANEAGQDINALLETMFNPAFKALEKTVQARDTSMFVQQYNAVMNSCNSCHAVTDHAFIKIIAPQQPAFYNQQYRNSTK